jgi:hypothetical protein
MTTHTITKPTANDIAYYEANGIDWAAIITKAHADQQAGVALPRRDKPIYGTTPENVLYMKAWLASIKVNGPARRA